MENISRNRGYILDGYPRSYKDSEGIFCDIDETKSEEDPDRFIINKEIVPNRILFIEGYSDEFLINRIKQLNITNSHYDEDSMNRRLARYKLLNQSPKGDLCLKDFFLRKKIDLLQLDCKLSEDKLVEQIKVFFEKVISNNF